MISALQSLNTAVLWSLGGGLPGNHCLRPFAAFYFLGTRMLRLGERDARGRLKERDGQPLIESVTYRTILCLRHGAIMGNGVRTKLTGDKAGKNQRVKEAKALEPRPGRDKKVQGSGFKSNENAHELDRTRIDLPDSYGETRAVLMAIEPYLLHVYWEVASDELEKAKHGFGDDHAQPETILRFYDVTNGKVDRGKPHNFFDLDIDLHSRSRYVSLWSPGKSYFVELGFRTSDGRFFPFVRSNVAKTPSAWPAPSAEQRHAAVHGNPEEGLSEPPNHGAHPTIKTGNQKAQARPQKEKRPRHQGEIAQDMDSAKNAPTQLVAGRELETQKTPFFQAALSLNEKVQEPSEKGIDADLTEMSERAFAFGVSSERVASARKDKDSADR